MREDIKNALTAYKIKTFGNNGNIEKIETYLKPDETVLYITPTNVEINTIGAKTEKKPGIFALTDKRIIFYFKVLFSQSVDVFNLSEINSFDMQNNILINSVLRLHTNTKSIGIMLSYKKEVVANVTNLLHQAIENSKQGHVAYPAAQAVVVDIPEQLKKLAELKDIGILSEEEFNTKKSELLNRM